jgi:hypothetical protein
MPPPDWVALSVKQPWAALLVAGVKTIEVRTWPTGRRGTVLIHAGRIPDDRPDGWAAVDTPELRRLAALTGGLVGVAELVGCIEYITPTGFAADAGRHRNPPHWFAPPRLYGLEFRHARPLPFRPLPGKTFFFPVGSVTVTAPEAG